ncbi:MAG: NYN domain-containing protein, partial [Acidobacteria bacterium]|nr:NYN domain-containing protein [Acidobacteriota bacterium]
ADWTRHGEMSRAMSQHGVQMVQRHPGPRGDKNGADINLALDALEMALTKPHIDAFAIVSGDSDFISLVEKLKQYNKTVYVVGGRAFTSTILQKNCREFISYESLLAPPSPAPQRHGRTAQRVAKVGTALPLSNVAPLLCRALEVLARREVQPQLGLLKSTMIQLDSSFTERDYGASSFRQFVEMLEKERLVKTLRSSGHYLVEMPRAEEVPSAAEPVVHREDALPLLHKALKVIDENDLWGQLDANTVKEYVQRLEHDFDEKRFGFGQFAELLNYAQDLGLVRLEPDANSVLRVFPGTQFTPMRSPLHPGPQRPAFGDWLPSETASAAPVLSHEETETSVPPAETDEPQKPRPRRSYRRRSRTGPRTPRQPQPLPSEKT